MNLLPFPLCSAFKMLQGKKPIVSNIPSKTQEKRQLFGDLWVSFFCNLKSQTKRKMVTPNENELNDLTVFLINESSFFDMSPSKTWSNWLQVPGPELLQPFDASTMPYNAIADLWADAQMEEVLRYLYGNSHLKLPEEWKCLFPSEVK